MRRGLRFRCTRNQIRHPVHGRLQNVAHQIGHTRIARGLGIKIDDERRNYLRRVFATMCGEQDFHRLKQRWRLASALQYLADLFLMPIRHCGNDCFLVFEIAINQTNADPGLGGDVVHAGLVEASLGEADQGCIENLRASI
jgi:hypothetical protein